MGEAACAAGADAGASRGAAGVGGDCNGTDRAGTSKCGVTEAADVGLVAFADATGASQGGLTQTTCVGNATGGFAKEPVVGTASAGASAAEGTGAPGVADVGGATAADMPGGSPTSGGGGGGFTVCVGTPGGGPGGGPGGCLPRGQLPCSHCSSATGGGGGGGAPGPPLHWAASASLCALSHSTLCRCLSLSTCPSLANFQQALHHQESCSGFHSKTPGSPQWDGGMGTFPGPVGAEQGVARGATHAMGQGVAQAATQGVAVAQLTLDWCRAEALWSAVARVLQTVQYSSPARTSTQAGNSPRCCCASKLCRSLAQAT